MAAPVAVQRVETGVEIEMSLEDTTRSYRTLIHIHKTPFYHSIITVCLSILTFLLIVVVKFFVSLIKLNCI